MTFELDLSGRRALVTGAGQGVGRAVALGLAAAGAEVLVNDLDADRAADVVEEVGAAGGSARASVFDVTDHEAVLGAVAELGVGVEVATGRRKQARTAFLDDVVATLPIIDYDLDVARAHNRLLVAVRAAGRPRGAHDLLIAATALATGRIVVTSDRPGFDGLPGVTVRRPG